MWRELHPRHNRGGWIWAVSIVVVLAALQFMEVTLWP